MRVIDDAKDKISEARTKGFSMELRFLFTLLVVIFTLVTAFTAVFAAFGAFDVNKSRTEAILTHELNSLTDRIKKEYSTIASHSISLSEMLIMELERQLDKADVSPAELKQHPEVLNDLLESVYPTMAAELKAIKSSGAFVILDATINPALENAENSRSGIFLKNISAQNNTFSSHYDLRYLCGPLEVGRSHALTFLPQWSLEFDVTDMDMYRIPMENAAENSGKTLSQLYYWTDKENTGGANSGQYCSVPLIASDGTVIGVCGYEISAMQFKLAYAPVIAEQNYVFCMLASSDESNIYFENSMFAGNYAVAEEQPDCAAAKPAGSGLLEYVCGDGVYVGNHCTMQLYPNSSCFAEREFTVALLTPKAQILRMRHESNAKFVLVVTVLLIIGIVLSVVLCRLNIKPIKKALNRVQQSNPAPSEKTYIREIDDLFEFLAQKDSEDKAARAQIEREKAEAEAKAAAHGLKSVNPERYEFFLENLSQLTPKERDVFDLYLKGYKSKDIAEELGIAFNTVKFHNKNIYDKLGISSRSELLWYAKIMNENHQTI